jgi:hypothetical protein
VRQAPQQHPLLQQDFFDQHVHVHRVQLVVANKPGQGWSNVWRDKSVRAENSMAAQHGTAW